LLCTLRISQAAQEVVDFCCIYTTKIKYRPNALQMGLLHLYLYFRRGLTPLGITKALRLVLRSSVFSELKSDFATLAARMSLIWPAASWRPTICLHKAPVVDAGKVAAMQLQTGEKRRLILCTQRTKQVCRTLHQVKQHPLVARGTTVNSSVC